jgi:hypothetical protein
MSAEEIGLENLTPGVLARSANLFCKDCRDLRQFGLDVIEELPPIEDIDPVAVVGRFAGFAALCPREKVIPEPKCNPGLCGEIGEDRKCLLKELVELTAEQRIQRIRELAHGNNFVEFTAD